MHWFRALSVYVASRFERSCGIREKSEIKADPKRAPALKTLEIQAVEVTIKVKQKQLTELYSKRERIGWAKVRMWGVAPDVLVKRAWYAWDSAVPILALEKAAIEPRLRR